MGSTRIRLSDRVSRIAELWDKGYHLALCSVYISETIRLIDILEDENRCLEEKVRTLLNNQTGPTTRPLKQEVPGGQEPKSMD